MAAHQAPPSMDSPGKSTGVRCHCLLRELPCDPAIPLLGIYSEKMKILIVKDARTPVFIAALFTIAKTRKQPKCPSTEDWIKTMWYIYTMEYCSAIKKDEIIPLTATWMDLEIIILSEESQKKTNVMYCFYVEYKKKLYKWTFYKTETDSQTYKTAALPYVKTRSFKIKAKTFTNLMSKPHPRMITSVPLGRNLGICTHLQSRVIAMCSQVLFIH